MAGVITLGFITEESKIICPRAGESAYVFQVPAQSRKRIAQWLGSQPAADFEESIAYAVYTGKECDDPVKFGEFAQHSMLGVYFAIEHCNKDPAVQLGPRLRVRGSKVKSNHSSVRKLLANLPPGQRAVACVRGVALLRWREGDEWAAYHLLPLWTLHHHRDTVLPLLLRVLGWLSPDPLHEDPYSLGPHVNLCRGAVSFKTTDWAAVNEEGRTLCYRDPINFHLLEDPWTAPAGSLTTQQGAPEEEEEGTINEMLAPEHQPEYMLQAGDLLDDVAVRDPANPSLLRHVPLDGAVDTMRVHGPGVLFWRLRNLQAADNVLQLKLLLRTEGGQEPGAQGGSQGSGWEALVHDGQQLELWASSAEGAPCLVVRTGATGSRAPAGSGLPGEKELGNSGDSNGDELRVVGELGVEQLRMLQGAGGANVAVTLAPVALKMLVGCYSGDVVFSRGALREGEGVLKQLLRGLPAVEEAVMPGEEEVKVEEDVPGPVSTAPQEVLPPPLALLAVQEQLGQGVQPLPAGAVGASGEQHNQPSCKVCSACGTTAMVSTDKRDKSWRIDKEGKPLCNVCGVFYQKKGVPPSPSQLDATRPRSKVGGAQQQLHGRRGRRGGRAGRGRGRGAAPLIPAEASHRTVPRTSPKNTMSSKDKMEEESGNGDLDSGYVTGSARKRARLDPGASSTGLDNVAAAALVGLAAGSAHGPGPQGATGAGAAALGAPSGSGHGLEPTEQQQGADASMQQLPDGDTRAGAGVGLEVWGLASARRVVEGQGAAGASQEGAMVGQARAEPSQAGAGPIQAGVGAGVLQRGLAPRAGELGSAGQEQLDVIRPPEGSREASTNPTCPEAFGPPLLQLLQQQQQQLTNGEHEQQLGQKGQQVPGRRRPQSPSGMVGSRESTPGGSLPPQGFEVAAPPGGPAGPATRPDQPLSAPTGAVVRAASPVPEAVAAAVLPHGHVASPSGVSGTTARGAPGGAAAQMADGGGVGRAMGSESLQDGAGSCRSGGVAQVEKMDVEVPGAGTGDAAATDAELDKALQPVRELVRARALAAEAKHVAEVAQLAQVVQCLQVRLREREEELERVRVQAAELKKKLAEAEAREKQAMQRAREELKQRMQQIFQ